MIRKLLCLIGWHEWVWKLRYEEANYMYQPPSNAKCKHCGITFGRKKNENINNKRNS